MWIYVAVGLVVVGFVVLGVLAWLRKQDDVDIDISLF